MLKNHLNIANESEWSKNQSRMRGNFLKNVKDIKIEIYFILILLKPSRLFD
jgi:hypothetical protein